MSNTLNKDFYKYVPAYLQNTIDKQIKLFGEYDWFEDAWNEYREMVLHVDQCGHFPSPTLYFEKRRNEEHLKKYFIPTIDEQIRMEAEKNEKDI